MGRWAGLSFCLIVWPIKFSACKIQTPGDFLLLFLLQSGGLGLYVKGIRQV